MEIGKQKIDCKVYDCKYCNYEESKCNLNEIKVRNCCDEQNKEATMCSSYDKRTI